MKKKTILMAVMLTILSPYLYAEEKSVLTEWSLVDPYNVWAYTNPTIYEGRLDQITSNTGSVGWVVSDFALPPFAKFKLTLSVTSPYIDDDIIGFAFGYQDNNNFYLVDWKQTTQTYNWGDPVLINDDIAEYGLKLKKIHGSWTRDGLWGGKDGIGVSELAGPLGKGWSFGTDYVFEVELSPGHIVVNLDGAPLFDVYDNTFQGGRMALYGFSQDNIHFKEIVVAYSLTGDNHTITETAGGTVNFTLDAGPGNKNRDYLLFGSVTGTSPGVPLPGGMAILPLNWDIFTNMVISYANLPIFSNFMGQLNSSGRAFASLNLGPVSGATGLVMDFAYALANPWDVASNTFSVEITP